MLYYHRVCLEYSKELFLPYQEPQGKHPFYTNGLPRSLNQEFMALPYHLYMLSTQHQSIEQVRPLAYGTAVILIPLVFAMNLIAFYIRYKHRQHE
jgi:phosphate transport system permease protein